MMMERKIFKTSTRRAYLNNYIRLTSTDGQSISIVDSCTGKEYQGNDIKIRLCAGNHELKCTKDDQVQVEHIYIEDAIKLGGGKIKNAFVSDSTPWLFVIMKDRLYCFNEETKEERIEYGLSPDLIEYLGNQFFLFNNNQDFSIYDVEKNEFIFRFSNHLYSNNHAVVYLERVSEEERIIAYDYVTGGIIISSVRPDKWSLEDDTLFLSDIQNRHFYIADLLTNEIECLNVSNFVMFKRFEIIGHYVIDYREGAYYNYNFIDLNDRDDKHTPRHISITSTFRIVSIGCKEIESIPLMRDNYDNIMRQYREEIVKTGIVPVLQYYKIEAIKYEEEKYVIYLKEYREQSKHIPQLLHIIKADITSPVLKLDEVDSYVKDIPTTKQSEDISNHKEGLASSKSGNIYIKIENGNLYRCDKGTDNKEQILIGVFDNKHYPNAYFTRDGNHIVLKKSNNELGIVGFEDMEEIPFAIEAATVPDGSSGFNGYQLILSISEGTSKDPVWRDPITMQKITKEEMSNRIYLSPDKEWSAQTNFKVFYKYIVSGEEFTSLSHREMVDQWKEQLDWENNTEESLKSLKVERRREELKSQQLLFERIKEYFRPFSQKKYEWASEEKREKLIEIDLKERIENEITKPHFSQFMDKLLFERMDFVIYKNMNDKKDRRAYIGASTWFLNYVSFSYDSKYMAYGAKMNYDNGEPGVFVIYDLIKEKDVVRMDLISDNLWAVWMTLFSKNGDVAMYDSRPRTIMLKNAQYTKEETNFLDNRSLLTFSPKGHLLALSSQGYIDYTHHPNEAWGHQPCGNVYIYSMDEEKEIAVFHDHGENINGISTRAGNVASAAFSLDEKRLLTVGSDGVVVIRNLNLEDSDSNNPKEENAQFKDGYYWGTKVEMASGYIIHNDEPEWLRDISDTELKDAYVDEYGVKYSKDKKVLLDCNCTLDEYKIPSGVVEIREKAFFTAKIGKVHIPWTVKSIGYRGLFSYGIENIECSNANPSFMSWHGVLYSKDMKTLVAYPQGRKDVLYRLPQKTLKIADGVFSTFKDTLHMQEAHSVMSMNPDAYESCGFCSAREEQFLHDNQGIINYPYVIILPNVEGIEISNFVTSNEMCYVDEKGVVYDWKKKKLLFFHPAIRIEDYAVIDGCEEIGEEAFSSFGYFDPRTQGGESISNSIKYITLPASLCRVSGNPFKDCVSLMSIYVPNGDVERFKVMLPQELHSKIKTYCKN